MPKFRTMTTNTPQIASHLMEGKQNIYITRIGFFLRTKKDIHLIKPGITGYAQVNGRDLLSISEKVELDEHYFKKRSLVMNFNILIKTFYVVIKKIGISH
jgi:O-antigen biosynthesis protein WbqP